MHKWRFLIVQFAKLQPQRCQQKYLTVSIPLYTTDPTYHSMAPYKRLSMIFNFILVSETRFCCKLHFFPHKLIFTQETRSLNQIFTRMPQCQEVSHHGICLCLVMMHVVLLTADKLARCNIFIQDTCVFSYSVQETMAQQLFQSRRTKNMLLCCLRTCNLLLPAEPILLQILFTITSTYDKEHPIFHLLLHCQLHEYSTYCMTITLEDSYDQDVSIVKQSMWQQFHPTRATETST